MHTIRAKELKRNSIIIFDNNERLIVDKVDVTHRGNIMTWLGEEGLEIRFFKQNDVITVE